MIEIKESYLCFALIGIAIVGILLGATIVYKIMDIRTDRMLEELGYEKIKARIAQIDKDRKWLDRLIVIMRLDQKRQEILTEQLEKLAEDTAKEGK